VWNNSNDLVKEFIMKSMPPNDDAPPVELRIIEVEEQREINQETIE
jgi:hypothetical protein